MESTNEITEKVTAPFRPRHLNGVESAGPVKKPANGQSTSGLMSPQHFLLLRALVLELWPENGHVN